MGVCECGNRTSLEFILNDIWRECDLTKLNPDSYVNFFKRFLENDKDLNNLDEMDQFIYSLLLNSYIHKEFFLNLKNDLIFLGNNGKKYHIMLALIFFTKYNDSNSIGKAIDRLYSIIKNTFSIKKDIQTDKEFFKEVFDIYLLLCSQLSLKYLNKSDISKDYLIEDNQDILKKIYDKKNRDLLIKKLVNKNLYFFLSKFLSDNALRLNHLNIRDELRSVYMDNI